MTFMICSVSVFMNLKHIWCLLAILCT